jgi:hypothetical protein
MGMFDDLIKKKHKKLKAKWTASVKEDLINAPICWRSQRQKCLSFKPIMGSMSKAGDCDYYLQGKCIK